MPGLHYPFKPRSPQRFRRASVERVAIAAILPCHDHAPTSLHDFETSNPIHDDFTSREGLRDDAAVVAGEEEDIQVRIVHFPVFPESEIQSRLDLKRSTLQQCCKRVLSSKELIIYSNMSPADGFCPATRTGTPAAHRPLASPLRDELRACRYRLVLSVNDTTWARLVRQHIDAIKRSSSYSSLSQHTTNPEVRRGVYVRTHLEVGQRCGPAFNHPVRKLRTGK